ncbi:unnamed protein product [Lota lota]
MARKMIFSGPKRPSSSAVHLQKGTSSAMRVLVLSLFMDEKQQEEEEQDDTPPGLPQSSCLSWCWANTTTYLLLIPRP